MRGGRPVCLGGAVGGLKDNWRSLFRQPLVDPCRSGAGVTDQSVRVCAPLGLRGRFGAFKQVSLMRCFAMSLRLSRSPPSLNLTFNGKINALAVTA